MSKYAKSVCAALALTFAVGTLPATAAPVPTMTAPAASSDVVTVQWNQQRRFDRRQDRREDRFERRNGQVFYNGRRGYRERRAGYRQHNGYWFPATAFIAGAILGSVLNDQPAVRSSRSAHVQWCVNRWRSYHAYDNTYQPSEGRRRACVSPYS